MKIWIALLLTSMALTGCFSKDGPAPAEQEEEETAPEPVETPEAPPVNITTPTLRFVAVGDQGTGKDAQYQVAASMHAVCQARGCDFALGLGDNIYEVGPSSPHDEQFETKFEQPYAAFDIPFYMVQGNHDNSGDPLTGAVGQELGFGQWYETGNHEVAYHYRTDRTSEKWQMPDRYYHFDAMAGNSSATFFAMDTNLLMYWGFGVTLDPDNAPQMGDQTAWFDAAAAQAEGQWRIAIGHHPYRSNGDHGNAGSYDGFEDPNPLSGPYVKSFYEDTVCPETDIILTGHDHDLQWLPAGDACPGVEQIVSGGGAKTRSAGNEGNPTHFEAFDTYGFLWVEIDGPTFTGVFFDGDGNELFSRTLTK